jgi:DNA mismatch repair protein MutH
VIKRECIAKLQSISPSDNLYHWAEKYHITVKKNGKVNKGWVGQTLERILELENSNAQKKDGVDFELKSTSLIMRDGKWQPKETIKVTMLNPSHVLEETFETSAFWNKLSSLILVGCFHSSATFSQVIKVKGIDFIDNELYEACRVFWQDIQNIILNGEIPRLHDVGRSSDWVQLRPTGNGKYFSTCPITGEKFPARSFYLTKKFISKMLFE